MNATKTPRLSIVVPVFNEARGLHAFHDSLITVLKGLNDTEYEVIYCDDGSRDDTAGVVRKICKEDDKVRLISLTRNFGKEIAMAAGIEHARGEAILTIDGDGQHPVELMPEFLERWKTGAKVVVGIRTHNSREGAIKRYGSKLFYGLFSRLFGLRMIPGSTDYRLIDREVQQQFIRLSERRRITRGLIDWLGYPQEQIKFAAKARTNDAPGYSVEKLFHLAIDSMVSMSISPLYIAAYIGFVMLPLSIIVGIFMVVDALIGDPLHLNITGSGYVVVILLLLVSVLLISQGIIGLYLSHIHTESQNRPLYVIDRQESVGIDEK